MSRSGGQSDSVHGRFSALDGMRGVAAIMVVLLHIGNFGLGPFKPAFGYLAVDLFFALSGFVISYNYDARLVGGMMVGSFMLRRVIRLYPLYFVGLFAGFLTTPIILMNVRFSCLIPGFDGASSAQAWKDALWDRFYTGAPGRQRQSVERYSIVKRA